MKVYRCNAHDYALADGMVIVAANSPKEAKKATSSYIYWENLYLEKDFKEIPDVEYKEDKPKVIAELHYFY